MLFFMMPDIKLLIFDLDGTLIDAYPAIISSFNYAMRALKYPVRKDNLIRRAVGWGDEKLFRPFIKPADLKEALKIYRRHHAKSLLRQSRLFPGAKKVLTYLKSKGYKLAVASNRPTRFSRILIRHLKIRPYFDYILCADKLKHIKPHPEILRKIMHRQNSKPLETIYVGDMVIDAQAGRRAAVKTIIVTTGSSSRSEIRRQRPWRIIYKITDLLKIL